MLNDLDKNHKGTRFGKDPPPNFVCLYAEVVNYKICAKSFQRGVATMAEKVVRQGATTFWGDFAQVLN